MRSVAAALLWSVGIAFAGVYEDGEKYLARKDYKHALGAFHEASARGDAPAQRQLGFMYYRGLGVAQDNAKALEWFVKAARQGDLESQVNLGIMYENGLGVVHDDAQSAYWFRMAAEQGHRRSQFRSGEILYTGQGVPRDPVEADKWWQLALGEEDSLTPWMRSIVEAAERKMTPEQIAEAKQRAAEWTMARIAR
jgi:uncharacterized protein